ncbi:hypothetical protein NL676_016142 [Syzygium grande]|nr:hypothetical protein NL676_016142 [Syzygium grande]
MGGTSREAAVAVPANREKKRPSERFEAEGPGSPFVALAASGGRAGSAAAAATWRSRFTRTGVTLSHRRACRLPPPHDDDDEGGATVASRRTWNSVGLPPRA